MSGLSAGNTTVKKTKFLPSGGFHSSVSWSVNKHTCTTGRVKCAGEKLSKIRAWECLGTGRVGEKATSCVGWVGKCSI